MQKLLIALAMVAITATSHGQGILLFANRVEGVFDAPVGIEGTGIGAGTLGGLEAQLYDGDTFLGSTTFRANAGADAFYLLPRNITIEGNTGQELTSLNIRFLLGGAELDRTPVFKATPATPPDSPANIGGYPGGLEPHMIRVPEPATMTVALLGIGTFLLRRRAS